jgi:hypothetical protein
VVAASRNIAALCSLKAQYGDSLLPIALDVGDKAAALFRIVDADEPPLRVFPGRDGLPMTRREYADRLATWEKWNNVALEAQGTVAAT